MIELLGNRRNILYILTAPKDQALDERELDRWTVIGIACSFVLLCTFFVNK